MATSSSELCKRVVVDGHGECCASLRTAHVADVVRTWSLLQPADAVFAKVDTVVLERIAKVMSYIKTSAGGQQTNLHLPELRLVLPPGS